MFHILVVPLMQKSSHSSHLFLCKNVLIGICHPHRIITLTLLSKEYVLSIVKDCDVEKSYEFNTDLLSFQICTLVVCLCVIMRVITHSHNKSNVFNNTVPGILYDVHVFKNLKLFLIF